MDFRVLSRPPGEGDIIVNALIKRASIYVEDHGLWTVTLDLEYDSTFGGVQGFGGYALGRAKGPPRAALALFIMRCCEVVGVRSWEEIKGKHVRVHIDGGGGCSNKIHGIGNLMDSDRWFYPGNELKTLDRKAVTNAQD